MKFDLCSLVGTSQMFIVLTLDFMYQPDGNIFAGFAIYNMGFTKRGSDHVLNGLAFQLVGFFHSYQMYIVQK